MSILNSYNNSNEIVKPEYFVKGDCHLPSIAIVTFKQELIDLIDKDKNFEKFSTFSAGTVLPIYKTKHNNKDIIVYRTLIGSPATVSIMEELHARGVEKFIFFGSCGTLDNSISSGKFIIPEEAYRDEGTSYHYMPASDFISVETAPITAKIFDKYNFPYILTKTWTTDALYRETLDNMNSRKDAGCLVVEMECSAIMAMSKLRNIEAYQFLYSDDTLDGDFWDIRTLKDSNENILEACLNIALKLASEI